MESDEEWAKSVKGMRSDYSNFTKEDSDKLEGKVRSIEDLRKKLKALRSKKKKKKVRK